MEGLQILVLSVVQAITEFLPVSSTAHLILTSRLLGVPQSDFWGSFNIFIQLGSILAVLVLFGKKVWEQKEKKWQLLAAFVPTMILGVVAHGFVKEVLFKGQAVTGWALIVGGIGFIVWTNNSCRSFLASVRLKKNPEDITSTQLRSDASATRETPTPLGSLSDSRLKSGGARFVEGHPLDFFHKYKKYAAIGLIQCLAFIPGVSRSAATIFGGRAMGLKQKEAVEFF
ncbi:hypothetical protein FWH30_01520, partial [Microgenomates group bacterium]|nr:hypothetical protein [Microgenomates group bacterium]